MKSKIDIALRNISRALTVPSSEEVRVELEQALHHLKLALKRFVADAAEQAQTSKDDENPDQMRFLSALDNSLLRKVVDSMLRKRGHRVVSAESTSDALGILENDSFDVLLLDMTFPNTERVGFLETLRIRDQVLLRHTPVIALTNMKPEEIAIDTWVSLLDAYVNAPLESERFFYTVQRVLARSGSWS